MKILAILTGLTVLAIGYSHAQSPYQGQEQRAIKSLSDSEKESLLNGEGMGFAKAAELNGYPGPAHVLELADSLELTAQQLKNTQSLFNLMKTRAASLGEELIQAESDLDTLFAERRITPVNLAEKVAHIARLKGEIRRVHLETHILQTELLSAIQIARYGELRGYHGSDKHMNHEHRRHN